MKWHEAEERYVRSFIGMARPRNGTIVPGTKDTAECRRMAEHYLACARQMSDPDDRAALLQMAEYWTKLAEYSEREEREKSQK
jgi:hypothetical protein